eukprot:Rmarinus@m.9413
MNIHASPFVVPTSKETSLSAHAEDFVPGNVVDEPELAHNPHDTEEHGDGIGVYGHNQDGLFIPDNSQNLYSNSHGFDEYKDGNSWPYAPAETRNYQLGVPQPHSSSVAGPWSESNCTPAFVGGGGVTCVAYDPEYEVLWGGGEEGIVSSFHLSTLHKYSSVVVAHEPVIKVMPISQSICSLTSSALHIHTKGGLRQKILPFSALGGATSAALVDEGRVMVSLDVEHLDDISTLPPEMLPPSTMSLYDIHRGSVLMQGSAVPGGVVVQRRGNKFMACGTRSGNLVLYDPVSMSPQFTLPACYGSVLDLDVLGNMVITCGYFERHPGVLEPTVSVCDTRMMKELGRMTGLTGEVSKVRFHPTFSSMAVLLTTNGTFCLVDALQEDHLNTSNWSHLMSTGQMFTAMDISSSSQCIAFGDSLGSVHSWTLGNGATANQFPTVLPEVTNPPPSFELMDEEEPIPIQFPPPIEDEFTRLLSDMPRAAMKSKFFLPRIIHPNVLSRVQRQDFVSYIDNRGLKRYTSDGFVSLESQVVTKESQQRSHRRLRLQGSDDDPPAVASPTSAVTPEERRSARLYQNFEKVEINFSKLESIEGFDFSRYNRTRRFCGLENGIPNSYCNPALQVLYLIPPIRVCMLSHLCDREWCISCELGFLFHMLDHGKGSAVHAGNLLRAFRQVPQAAALGLHDDRGMQLQTERMNIAHRMEIFCRFALEQLNLECQDTEPVANAPMPNQFHKNTKPEGSKPTPTESIAANVVDRTFGAAVATSTLCSGCKHKTHRTRRAYHYSFTYPDDASSVSTPFSELVESTLASSRSYKGHCEHCKKQMMIHMRKNLATLPDALSFGCESQSADLSKWWCDNLPDTNLPPVVDWTTADECERRWLPPRLRVTLERGARADADIQVESLYDESQDYCPRPPYQPSDERVEVTYELTGVIFQVHFGKDADSPGHVAAHIKVPRSYLSRTDGPANDSDDATNAPSGSGSAKSANRVQPRAASEWYLFNDFLICPVQCKRDVFSFSHGWKTPCVLYFTRVGIDADVGCPDVASPIGRSVLYAPPLNQPVGDVGFTPLGMNESLTIPNSPSRKGVLVAVDAEFVAIRRAETEIRLDGTKVIKEPSRHILGRVSVLRGDGPMEGVCFINDYINTREPVADYLTRWSGLVPGDLDPLVSRHHVTSLKVAYVKLRHLVDSGCVFIGHGLWKDFRIINIFVPPTQIIDTVELFHLQHNRKISLRYLACYLLDTDIQSTSHDSIEDAQTALRLYKKYCQLKEAGKLQETLTDIYRVGRETSWDPAQLMAAKSMYQAPQ